jgi:DNA-directed RNA polymerase specialized sigma24 family protein
MGLEIAEKDDWQEILNKALKGDAEALGTLCQRYLKRTIFMMKVIDEWTYQKISEQTGTPLATVY